ncbi:tripartite ATP-independent periplasmic transporter, DctQ family [Heliorestis convoluta]|uniref:Tripartite ATP-independent periplasmic transporter, DctQ family n=2 Tax=Heliorestis convoluta TaxID=356322 RepID=A0A5Q2N390_9FIRM|nr:tripartite ATP-independent periplasmic transporter, DctQ family [Heliorestis convoluta]
MKNRIVDRLDRTSYLLNHGLAFLAGSCLLLMMALVVGNAVMRFFGAPILGTTEIVGWLTALSIALGLGYTQITRGYVEINALVERFPPLLKKILHKAVLVTSMLFFALVSWQLVLYGLTVKQNGNLSETLWIPFYPLIFLIALGFAGLTFAIFVDFFKQLVGDARK